MNNIPVLTIIALAALASSMPSSAGGPVSIPAETFKAMKKGKRLNLLWTAPGFDPSRGVRVGKVQNASGEDEDGQVVVDYLPGALRRFIKADAPLTLHLAVVAARTLSKPNDAYAKARVELEGRIVDEAGSLVAAFDSQGVSALGGNKGDSLRYATDIIVFAMTKDLFSFAMPSETAPATIIGASGDTVPRGGQPGSSPRASSGVKPGVQPPAQQGEGEKPGASKNTAPSSGPQTQAEQANAGAFLAPLPEAARSAMKPGQGLGELWVDPRYERQNGFAIGEVRYLVDKRNPGVGDYLPEALQELGNPGAPCFLQMGITELEIRVNTGKGISSVRLGVEGRLIDKSGSVLAAFRTRESSHGVGDPVEDCRNAARKVVQAIRRDLQ